jgi:tetratricopeptide (TPR) repeat protein
MGCVRPWAQTLSALGLLVLLVGCGMSFEARAALDAGRQTMQHGRPRVALEHLRNATRIAPDSAETQLALGEAAETLGELDEALAAYQAAAGHAPSPATWLRLGEMADRMGRVDLAIQSLEKAHSPWREHAWGGIKYGAAPLVACVPTAWSSISTLWSQCLPAGLQSGRAYFRASRELVNAQFGGDARQGPTPFNAR